MVLTSSLSTFDEFQMQLLGVLIKLFAADTSYEN